MITVERNRTTITDTLGRDISQTAPVFIVLKSADDRDFCMSSTRLRLTSGFFRANLHHSYTNEDSFAEDVPVVKVSEMADVIGFLAHCMDPISMIGKRWATYDIRTLDSILKAALKYDAPCVTRFVNLFVVGHWSILAQQPVKLYTFVCEFDFGPLKTKAAHETLRSKLIGTTADFGNVPVVHLQTLIAFHEARIRSLTNAMWQGCRLETILNQRKCTCGASSDNENAKLDNLASRIRSYAHECPLGDALWFPNFWKKEFAFVGLRPCDQCSLDYLDVEAIIAHLNSEKFDEETRLL